MSTKKIKEDLIRERFSYMKLPGFEFETGWDDLIEKMCEEIALTDKNREVRFVQLKEKYGSGRFYSNGCTDKIYAIIDKYEQLSAITCEICGKKGKPKVTEGFGWYKTLCEKHAKELGYINIKRNKPIKSKKAT
jgi:hypothetical protein